MSSRFFLWTPGSISQPFPYALCFFLKHILYHPTFIGKPSTTASHRALTGTVTRVSRSGSEVPIRSLSSTLATPNAFFLRSPSGSPFHNIPPCRPLPNRSPPAAPCSRNTAFPFALTATALCVITVPVGGISHFPDPRLPSPLEPRTRPCPGRCRQEELFLMELTGHQEFFFRLQSLILVLSKPNFRWRHNMPFPTSAAIGWLLLRRITPSGPPVRQMTRG